jgi:HAE1 family hydrophobic/amphiphilic exporter-1
LNQEQTPQASSVTSERVDDPVRRTFEVTTQRPVAIFMVVLAIAVFGYVSYQRLPLNMMPDISYPTLTIRTDYPDTAPEEVENLISRAIEQRLGVVSNLVSITSISRAGISDVILEFGWGTEMNDAVQTVRENLDRLQLPRGVNRPLILRYDPTQDPIMRIGLYGSEDLFALRLIAEEEIKQELEALKGVAAARVSGGLEEEIRVEISEAKLSVLGLGISDINRRLREENVNLAGGSLLDGQTQYLVRTLNEFTKLEDISELVVGERNGVEIRVKDVGTVLSTNKEREIVTRVNGVESVEIEIYKEADANIVATAQRVRNRLFGTPEQRAYVDKLARGEVELKSSGKRKDQIQQFVQLKEMTSFVVHSLPEGVELELLSDQSTFIKNSVDEVKQTAVIGGILAILVLYIFLRNPTHTVIVGLSIPISVVATFAPMNVFGVSLNIMSLGGLALGIGMLVDNSIVVLESIYRCREEGDDLATATVRGTGDVGGAVFASTLTTVAVFFPIVFVEGVAGEIFGDMAMTVVFALLASLGVALFFIPMLASRRVNLESDSEERSSAGPLRTAAQSAIVRLVSIDRLRALAEDDSSAIHKIWVVAVAIPQLLFEFGARVLWIVASAVVVALKAVVLLLGALLFFPVAAGVQRVRGHRPLALWQGLVALAEDESLFGRAFCSAIWNDLLAFPTVTRLGSDLPEAFLWAVRSILKPLRWVRATTPIKQLVRGIPGLIGSIGVLLLIPLGPIYLIARFAIFTTISLVGKILVHALMLAFLVGTASLVLFAALLFPILAPMLYLFERSFGYVSNVYPSLLRSALVNQGSVVALALVPFVVTVFYLAPMLGSELIPQVYQGEFDVELAMPVGTPLAATNAMIERVEKRILEEQEIAQMASSVGVDRTEISSSDRGEHTAELTVVLKSRNVSDSTHAVLQFVTDLVRLPGRIWGGITGESELAKREELLMRRIRARLVDLPQLRVDFSRPTLFSFRTPIELEIRGYDLSTLGRLGSEVEARLAGVPGLYDVKSSLQRGSPEVQIVYDRDLMAKYDLNVRTVAQLVREKVQGDVVTRFRKEDRRIDVLVRVGEADRASVADLRRLVVNPGGEVPIRLSSLADIQVHEGPSEIRRIDQQRAVLISANVSGLDLGTVTGLIQQALEGLDVPADVTFIIGGQNREMQTSLDSLTFALALAIFLVYIVMASQFESFLHPLVIMFTIPLALVGVILVLFGTGVPLSVVVFLGMIMLAGIVVNNAIVLVDYINQLRRSGMTKVEAIVEAGSVRLRPILMTTSTTILGLLPMALGLGEGAEIRTPMAITVVAGLISSTLLTLVVIPVIYSVIDRGE